VERGRSGHGWLDAKNNSSKSASKRDVAGRKKNESTAAAGGEERLALPIVQNDIVNLLLLNKCVSVGERSLSGMI
jgi:hypothetical protein